jgi:hypothetical protein
LIQSCTFAGNASPGNFGQPGYTGFGGGLYVGYFSNCTLKDSIFWNNFALEGQEITVGTGFLLDDPWESTLRMSYCDVKNGRAGIRVQPDCTLVGWTPGDADFASNIQADPLFVTGVLGRYYLSQTAAGQPQTSPCVDAGSQDAFEEVANSGIHLSDYTTRTDEELDDCSMVDIGYHYPLSWLVAPCRRYDLDFDGAVDMGDIAVLALYWLHECSCENDWCDGTDLNLDRIVNLLDQSELQGSVCWGARDEEPPYPDPAEWEIEPYATGPGCSISMTAEIARDAWIGGVKYYFECLSDSGLSSEWQQGTTYAVSGLDPETELCFRVMAKDALGNETHYSDPCCAACAPDVDFTPPAPPPTLMVEGNEPNWIRLVASESFDFSGVEYYFQNMTFVDGSHDSGWLTFEPGVMPSYIDVGLMGETQYCYQVRARDKSAQQNATDWSDILCRTTPEPPDKTAPAPVPAGPILWDRSLQDVNCTQCDGEPREYWVGPAFNDYNVVMRPDPNIVDESPGPLEFYFECEEGIRSSKATHPETDGWISFPQGGSLDPETGYVGYWYKVYVSFYQRELEFKFKVRDEWGNESGWSPEVKTHWY